MKTERPPDDVSMDLLLHPPAKDEIVDHSVFQTWLSPYPPENEDMK